MPRPSHVDHDQGIRSARGENLEDLGELEQPLANLCDGRTASDDMDFLSEQAAVPDRNEGFQRTTTRRSWLTTRSKLSSDWGEGTAEAGVLAYTPSYDGMS
jgi:hypothetical protein